MFKEKWDASLERGLDEGYFKHRHDVHEVKDFPGKRGWVGVFCPARVEGKVKFEVKINHIHSFSFSVSHQALTPSLLTFLLDSTLTR